MLPGSQLSPAGPGAPGALGSPASPNLRLDGGATRARCPGHLSLGGNQPLTVPSRTARQTKSCLQGGGQGTAGSAPRLGRLLAEQSLSGPLLRRSLNPWSPSFPLRPHHPRRSSGRGSPARTGGPGLGPPLPCRLCHAQPHRVSPPPPPRSPPQGGAVRRRRAAPWPGLGSASGAPPPSPEVNSNSSQSPQGRGVWVSQAQRG